MQFQTMDGVQQREVIPFLVLKGKAPKDIHEELAMMLDSSALAYATVKKWAAVFKAG